MTVLDDLYIVTIEILASMRTIIRILSAHQEKRKPNQLFYIPDLLFCKLIRHHAFFPTIKSCVLKLGMTSKFSKTKVRVFEMGEGKFRKFLIYG